MTMLLFIQLESNLSGRNVSRGDSGACEEQLYMLLKVFTQLEARDYGIQM